MLFRFGHLSNVRKRCPLLKAVPGWGEYFAKVDLLRPKIKCNSPHSRPGRVTRPSGQTPRRRQSQGNADQERERAPRRCSVALPIKNSPTKYKGALTKPNPLRIIALTSDPAPPIGALGSASRDHLTCTN